MQILFLGRRGRLLFIKGKAVYEGFYKEKWPRATRKLFISPFLKENAVIKTFIKGNLFLMAARSAEMFYKAFYKGKCNYKDFHKGNWPRAARKCFEIVVH